MAAWQRWSALAVALGLAGCWASTSNPDRLVPVATEMESIQTSQQELFDLYLNVMRASSFEKARAIRNEIIAQRMYAVDVQYSQYEAALTQETQRGGFAALTAAEGLSTAATLLSPAGTKTILSGLSTAVLATKGQYGSEVLLALTMRTIQKQMRASRNKTAELINRRMAQSVVDYPLAAALSDIEQYYRAGTLTSGVIDTSTTVGQEEKSSEEVRQSIALLPLEARRTAVITNASEPIAKPPRIEILNAGGVGFYEQRLVPSRIRELQKGVCLPQTGDFKDFPAVRAAILKYFEEERRKNPQNDWKDKSLPSGITNVDRVNLSRNPKVCPS